MKIRTDYVSNSSSSSFVITERANEAVKMFLSDFADFLADGYSYESLGQTMKVGYLDDGKKIGDTWPDYMSPEDFAVKFTTGREDDDPEYSIPKTDPDTVTTISFECDDYDRTSMAYLAFLYKYFEKFGFKPDASDSEKDFLDSKGTFLGRILDRLEVKEATNEDKK